MLTWLMSQGISPTVGASRVEQGRAGRRGDGSAGGHALRRSAAPVRGRSMAAQGWVTTAFRVRRRRARRRERQCSSPGRGDSGSAGLILGGACLRALRSWPVGTPGLSSDGGRGCAVGRVRSAGVTHLDSGRTATRGETAAGRGKSWCPGWDSNPHWIGFEPNASAGWATGAWCLLAVPDYETTDRGRCGHPVAGAWGPAPTSRGGPGPTTQRRGAVRRANPTGR